MKGLREFVIGFSFSLACVSLGGQQHLLDTSAQVPNTPFQVTKIDLFKNNTPSQRDTVRVDIFASIDHHSLIKESAIGQIPQDPSSSIDTPNDDEILSINIDGGIPIEYSEQNLTSQQVEVLHFEDADISAMLPEDISDEAADTADNPWTVVKGSKHIKNKQLLKELESDSIASSIRENFDLTLKENNEESYLIAEKIKSSLLFPIPNEILNDENLTPTFIKKKNKKQPSSSADSAKKSTPPSQKELTLIPTQTPAPLNEENTSKSFLNNISLWFSTTDETPPQPREKKAPLYSSQEATHKTSQVTPSDNSEFVDFYKTLQETSTIYKKNNIIPSELKLSFQPEKAEISGQTLRWLKAFSEATQNDDTYLQIRLDASTPTELQRKRLNLLYTIFINNGVDFKKIDTVFSLTEPNAFIIRTLKVK